MTPPIIAPIWVEDLRSLAVKGVMVEAWIDEVVADDEEMGWEEDSEASWEEDSEASWEEDNEAGWEEDVGVSSNLEHVSLSM
jgi:hypothetical protein